MLLKTRFTTITTVLVVWSCFLGTHCFRSLTMASCKYIVDLDCSSPEVKFYLYSRYNKDDAQLVTKNNITESYFTNSLSNKFILHGFNSGPTLNVLQNIKNEYLTDMDVNVWMIDYSSVSAGPDECYVAAVYNLQFVGKCAALFIAEVMRLSDVKELMHVIGFSLGGQLASYVAKHLKPVVLPRITGLDPALPLFYNWHLNRRLSRNDATFVDVIHTNAMIQGQLDPCGDVDFYVNGGVSQPHCKNDSRPLSCDHFMAPVYFAESIGSTTGFWSWPCPDWFDYFSGKCPRHGEHVLMGQHVNQSARGQFVLETNSESPYAQGDWGMTGTSNCKEISH